MALLAHWRRALDQGRQAVLAGSLLRSGTLAILDQAVVSGTNFAVSVLLGWSGRAELGIYYLALSMLVLFRGVQEQLITAPYMVYSNRRSGAEAEIYAGSTMIHDLILAALSSVAVGILLVSGLAPGEKTGFWLLLLGIAPLYLMRDFVRQILFAQLNLRMAFVLDLLVAGVQLGVMLPLALRGMLGVELVFLSIALAGALAVLLWAFGKEQVFRGQISAAWGHARENWKFARWALATQLIGASSPYIMPWVVATIHGTRETGTLGACTTIVGLSNMFLIGVGNFLSPKAARAFASGGTEALQKVLWQRASLCGSALGLASLFAFTAGGPVAAVVYGPEFSGCGLILGLLSLGALINSIGITAGNGLCAMDRPGANLYADVATFTVSLLAMLLLIPAFGTLGAAMATVCSTSADAAMRWTILCRNMRAIEPGRAA